MQNSVFLGKINVHAIKTSEKFIFLAHQSNYTPSLNISHKHTHWYTFCVNIIFVFPKKLELVRIDQEGRDSIV